MNFLARRSAQYLPFFFRRAPLMRPMVPLAAFSTYKSLVQVPIFSMSKNKAK